MSSGAPTLRSSAFRRAVSAGCVTCSASAARVTEPRRTTSTNASSWGCIEEAYANHPQVRLAFRSPPCHRGQNVTVADTTISIAGPGTERADEILTPDALAFVARLQRELGGRRRELLEARAERWQRLRAGELPDFLPETRDVREGDWRVPP